MLQIASGIIKIKLYKLIPHNRIVPSSMEEFERIDRTVSRTHIGDVYISTVFLGMDHNYDDGEPILFETMVFGGDEERQIRYCTYDEAVGGHKKIVLEVIKEARAGLLTPAAARAVGRSSTGSGSLE